MRTAAPSADRHPADPFKRSIALIIDGAVAYALVLLPWIGPVAGAAYMLTRDGMDWDVYRRRSLGKKTMKLSIRMTQGDRDVPDLKASAVRNWAFALPPLLCYLPRFGWLLYSIAGMAVLFFEGRSVLQDGRHRRRGDYAAGTLVIEEDPVPPVPLDQLRELDLLDDDD